MNKVIATPSLDSLYQSELSSWDVHPDLHGTFEPSPVLGLISNSTDFLVFKQSNDPSLKMITVLKHFIAQKMLYKELLTLLQREFPSLKEGLNELTLNQIESFEIFPEPCIGIILAADAILNNQFGLLCNEIQPRLFHALIENFEKKIASLPHLKVSQAFTKRTFVFPEMPKNLLIYILLTKDLSMKSQLYMKQLNSFVC